MSKLKINRGTTYKMTFHYERDGSAEPLTGATVYFTVKPVEYDTSVDDSTAAITKTVTTHTDAENGITEINLTPSDTYKTPGDYFYDIKVKTANNEIYKTVEGKLIIDGSPTNRGI